MNTEARDKKYLGRDAPATPIEIVGSEGSFLIDSRGKKYIDFVMGWCVGNSGWGNKEIRKTMADFKGPAYVLPDYLYAPWAELAELLAEITPRKLVKSFRATGGTEAVEIAIQASMAHTKRHKFLSIEGSYHGHSIGAMSLGDSGFRKWYNNLLRDCYKIKPPLDYKAARKTEKILEKADVAALIMEPVICNLGVLIPDQEFFDVVTKACREYGTLFIADEVASGFGRTGKMFASEHFGLEPDIMCLAKALTGGYAALGAAVMTEGVAKSMEFGFSFYSTFGWNPVNVEATIANIKYLRQHNGEMLENIAKMSSYFEERLRRMRFRYPPEIRIKGLAIGVEFGEERYAQDIAEKCFSRALLISGGPRIFSLFPALNIDMETAGQGLDILAKCV